MNIGRTFLPMLFDRSNEPRLENSYLAALIISLNQRRYTLLPIVRILISYLVGFSFYIPVFSQEIIHFTQDNGLPSNKVYMMTMDQNGFIWCATDKGIAMYNGDKFKTYTVKEGLPLNDIWKIYSTRDGKVWYFGRSAQLGYIENGRVYKFPSDDGSILNPTNFFFYKNIVGFNHHSCSYYLVGDTWRSECISKETEDKIISSRLDHWRKFNYPFGNRIIFCAEKKVLFFDLNFKLLKEVEWPEDGLRASTSFEIIYKNNEIAYVLVLRNLYRCNLKNFSIKKIFEFNEMVSTNLVVENDQIFINSGAGRFLIDGDQLIPNIDPIEGFNKSGIYGYFGENDGDTWINTFTNGIYKYPLHNKVTAIFSKENVQKVELFNNEFLVGIENKGLFRLDKNLNPEFMGGENASFYQLQSNKQGSEFNIISSQDLLIYKDGRVSKRVLVVPYRYYFSPCTNGKCYYEDSTARYISAKNALYVFPHVEQPYFFRYTGIYHINKYNDHIILGTTSGIKIFKDGIFYSSGYLNNVSITRLILFHDQMLIGTDGFGLYAYQDSLSPIPGTENLIINDIFIENDNLWLSTGFGIHEIQYKDGTYSRKRSIFQSNGLSSNSVNDLVKKGDTLYCATQNGLSIIDLNKLKLDYKPKLIFTQIVINDSIYQPDQKIVVTSKNQNSVVVELDIAFLNEHKQLKNYYKVEPANQDWVALRSSGFTIKGLNPGSYKIRIKSEGYNNNSNERSFDLVIEPRWFETRIFAFVSVATGILILVLTGYFIISGIVKRRNVKLKLENQLINLELHALRSKLNPHFIFNTFNAIQLYINNNQNELSEKYLILLSKHIRNVFEFSHLQTIPLEKEISLLKDYLEIEKTRFGDKIDISISVDEKLNLTNQQIPSMIIQPYVENSMVHGLFHKEGTGHLQVDFIYVNENTYQVRIIDDGIGFVQHESERISSTRVNHERIDLINQSGDFRITVNKTFLDESKKDKGTVISITISSNDRL